MALNRITLEAYITYIKTVKSRNEGKEFYEIGLSYKTWFKQNNQTNVISAIKETENFGKVLKLYKVGDHIAVDGYIFDLELSDRTRTVIRINEIIPIRTSRAVHRKRNDSSLKDFEEIPGFDGEYSE